MTKPRLQKATDPKPTSMTNRALKSKGTKSTSNPSTTNKGSTKKNSNTNSNKKEEEQELCPICDDICTCGQQQQAADMRRSSHSTSAFKVTSTGGRDHGRNGKGRSSQASQASPSSATSTNNNRSSFIWDFNVRGQLIPLENLYDGNVDASDEEDDHDDGHQDMQEYDSTDAECSDLVSGSDSDDHLSEVVDSGNSDSGSETSDLMEDEMMVYYQHVPVETPILDEHGHSVSHGNHGNHGVPPNRISAITPQILAAISKSLYNNNNNNGGGNSHHVLLVSDDGSTSISEDADHDDVEMIFVADDETDDSEGEIEREIIEGEGEGDHEEDSIDSESESVQWSRFRRVPVNAFYRRRHRPARYTTAATTNALRPSSVDPQFLMHCRRDSSGDELADVHQDSTSGTTDDHHSFGETTMHRPHLFHDSLLYYS